MCINFPLCECPVFERVYNWRARQKGCDDGGRARGTLQPFDLIWRRACVAEREGNTDMERGRKRKRETERWRGKYVM